MIQLTHIIIDIHNFFVTMNQNIVVLQKMNQKRYSNMLETYNHVLVRIHISEVFLMI